MTVTSALLQFAFLAALLTVTPGLDTALVLHSVLRFGRRSAFATAAGICTGSFVWGVAAAVGVAALMTTFHWAYIVLKIAGGLYLAYLGIRMLVKAIRGKYPSLEDGDEADAAPARSPLRAYGRGLLSNLLNPKVAAFYVAVLPLFLPADVNPAGMGALLAGVHAVESIIWFAAIILGAHSVRRWLKSRRAQRSIDGVTGVALLGFGAALGLSAR